MYENHIILGLVKFDSFIYEEFIALFNLLPICGVVDKKLFAVHAGISPDLKSLSKIMNEHR